MNKANVQRIIAVGGQGILNADENKLIIESENYPEQFLAVGNEHLKAYEYLRNSNLNWTFIGAPNIIDAEPTGNFTTSKNYPPQSNSNKINTGDLAMFMLNELEKNEFVKCRVGICN